MAEQQRILTSEEVVSKYGMSLEHKTILITGVATESIGGALALALSSAHPAQLILSGRSHLQVRPVLEKIQSQHPEVALRFLQMDLLDLDSVRRAVNEQLKDVQQIHHVVAVAGVMVPPYGRTKQGFEEQFGVNYLANFLLVNLLMPKIEAAASATTTAAVDENGVVENGNGSGGSSSSSSSSVDNGVSVVVCASAAVRTARIDFEDVGFDNGKTYDANVGYARSNVARVMFAKLLGEKLRDRRIRVFSVDPGAVKTNLHRHFTPEYISWLLKICETQTPLRDVDGREYPMPTMTSPSEGAATLVTAMLDPTISHSTGSYLHNNAVADEELHAHVVERENWLKLWALSEKLVGDRFNL